MTTYCLEFLLDHEGIPAEKLSCTRVGPMPPIKELALHVVIGLSPWLSLKFVNHYQRTFYLFEMLIQLVCPQVLLQRCIWILLEQVRSSCYCELLLTVDRLLHEEGCDDSFQKTCISLCSDMWKLHDQETNN